MRVADAREVLARCAEFHRDDAFGNELGGIRPDDVHAEDPIRCGIGENLDEAGRVAERACTAVGGERKAPRAVSDTRGFELLLRLPDPRNLGRRVDHPRHRIEIDMPVLSRDALRDGDALLFRLVREHRAADDIADRPHVREVGPALRVDGDEAALVERQLDRIGSKARGVRHAADRDDQPIVSRLLRLAVGILVADDDIVRARLDAGDCDARVNDEPLLREHALRFLRHRFVRGAEERGQRFEDGGLGAKAPPHAAHLESDHAGAHDAKPFRHVGNGERACVVEHAHVVEGDARQRARRRPGRHDHVRRSELCGPGSVDRDVPAGLETACAERAAAVEERHLVLLEEVQDAVVVLRNDFLLARQHPRDVDRQAADLYAVVGEGVARVLEVLGRLQQRLRRNAPDVRARATRRRLASGACPVVDAGRAEAELRAADGGDVAAGAGADDDNVEAFGRGGHRVNAP